jgi:hypothetical protein
MSCFAGREVRLAPLRGKDLQANPCRANYTFSMLICSSTMYRLKLRIRFVLSDKIAKQKTWFLLCSAACGGAPGCRRNAKHFGATSCCAFQFQVKIKAIFTWNWNSTIIAYKSHSFKHKASFLR